MTRRGRDDAGVGLSELLVSMAVLSVLFVALSAVTLSTLRANSRMQARLTDADDVQRVTETVSRTLRVAVVPTGEPAAVTVATPSAVSFYALLQRTPGSTATPLPSLVEFYRDPDRKCLAQAVTPARVLSAPSPSGSLYAWDSGRSAGCVAVTADVPGASAPWFTFYASGSGTAPVAPGADLTAAERLTVRSVAVRVPVTTDAGGNGAGTASLVAGVRVTLANVALADLGGQA